MVGGLRKKRAAVQANIEASVARLAELDAAEAEVRRKLEPLERAHAERAAERERLVESLRKAETAMAEYIGDTRTQRSTAVRKSADLRKRDVREQLLVERGYSTAAGASPHLRGAQTTLRSSRRQTGSPEAGTASPSATGTRAAALARK